MRVDVVSVASGAVVAALGALVLLDVDAGLDLSLGWMAVILTGAIGLIFVVSGLAGSERHD
jgi:hypothetical protein